MPSKKGTLKKSNPKKKFVIHKQSISQYAFIKEITEKKVDVFGFQSNLKEKTTYGEIQIRYKPNEEANKIAAFIADAMSEYRKNEDLKVSALVKSNKELGSACKEALNYIQKRTTGIVVDVKDTLRHVLNRGILKP